MSESKHNKQASERQEHQSAQQHQHNQLPYWKRMHQDWRFWVGVLFMVAAISINVLTSNLSLVLGRQPQVPSSNIPGK